MALLRTRYARGLILATTFGLSLMESACYEYSQIPTEAIQPVPGASFSFSLNDQGRAALSDRLGPAVGAVEGRYAGMVSNDYAVDVFAIETLGAGRSHWVGERVQIPRQFVTGISERRISKGKTAIVTIGAIAALAALIAGRSLVSDGPGPSPDPQGPGGSSSTRVPH